MDVHEAALTELIRLARQRGSLSIEDLRTALPVDSMTVEGLSHVLERLDQAGFDLDIDPTLLLPDNEAVARNAVSVIKRDKRDETELSQPTPEGRHQLTSRPASADAPILQDQMARHSNSAASAPMLPWIIAFAIVVLAAFAAFAF